jgi:glycosyltransferase involved in cell wall biosynthesis
MKAPAIRITAVPRSGHPNAGLQAMHFAARYGDEVWALPDYGEYLGDYPVSFMAFDHGRMRHLVHPTLLRRGFAFWCFLRMLVRPSRLYIVHNVVGAIPAWLLGRRYCIFIHGTDRRYLDRWWGKAVARGATDVFGVGFGLETPDVTVREVSNIFIPAKPEERPIESDFLFVLRNAAVKNPYYPIELAERLGPSLDPGIAVAGVGEDDLPPDYRQRLETLKAEGCRISYLGRLPYEEVIELMQKSRSLMIPSFSEGIPKVLLEALSLGMGVAASRALSFPPALASCVDWIDLGDWPSIAKLLDQNRWLERNEDHVRIAQEYLRKSHNALSSLYDQVYQRQLGFVPSSDRLAQA